MAPQTQRCNWITWTPKTGSVSSRAFRVGWSASDLLAMYGQVLAHGEDGSIDVQAYFQGPVRLEPPVGVRLTPADAIAMHVRLIDTPEYRTSDGCYLHPVYAPDDIVDP